MSDIGGAAIVRPVTTPAKPQHPEEYCHRCGGRNVPSWSVDSDRWNMATGEGTFRDVIMCPGCFVSLHENATGMRTSWMLVPDPKTSFRWMDKAEIFGT